MIQKPLRTPPPSGPPSDQVSLHVLESKELPPFLSRVSLFKDFTIAIRRRTHIKNILA